MVHVYREGRTVPRDRFSTTSRARRRSSDLSNSSPGRLVRHTEEIRALISPALHRVYLEDGESRSWAVIDDLKLEIATLKVRVVTLKHEINPH